MATFRVWGKIGGDAIRMYKYYNPDARGVDIQKHFARTGIKISTAYISQELNKYKGRSKNTVEIDETPPQGALDLNDIPPQLSQKSEEDIARHYSYPPAKKTAMAPKKESPLQVIVPRLSKKDEEELKSKPLEELEEMQDRAVIMTKTAIAHEVYKILNDPTADAVWRENRLQALAVLARFMD